ncbi:UDP-3-O-[3-hydroxymyristoyl] N-acetylglucosamine deacetylase [Anaerohalosphaera lusitana]|uniref:Multifunctional fusion protein n=1 Tax=Anaerohalosphaera lusitana TaxID=1936003 RepID=A0A1U9NIK6_9BACT|nr:UDP-3-O-acyl-N-acetylglucosamine deacetylase [Anaerohalosphaera lusitana]AQT67336.1 UDP-3-O-[3-hydroxymyristoyl] N-acetylglucosamine deacetylase [Anaerohalosphaera lusitana]
MKAQKTIKSEIKLSGKGLFSGKDVKLVFKPAEPDTGIVFVRTDFEQPIKVPVAAANITEVQRRSALKKGPATIETPEHCLAAINAMGIDNITIEIDSVELPGFDGSSDEFYKTLRKVGVEDQPEAPSREFVIKEPVSVIDGDTSIHAVPSEEPGLSITYDLDYTQHTGIGRQLYSCNLNTDHFERELANARTFCLEAEARQMQAHGIGTHLTPKDILVINSDGPIKNNYRYPNECVRHKIVDLIGDLAFVGRPVSGRIVAYKSGHAVNQKLAKKLAKLARETEKAAASERAVLNIRKIQRILPHRYPFLLVDKVIDIEGDSKITGIKNVTINEQFFQGHFPGTPVMPGVLIVEALAQVSGLLFAQKLEHTGKLAVLLTMDAVKIRKSVVPGDQLILCAQANRVRGRSAKCDCVAKVGDEVVAEAVLKFMLVDEDIM